jgi:hypothetical protein
LEDPNNFSLSVSTNAVNSTVTTSANMHPNFFWKLQLEQRNAEVLECGRTHAFHKPPLYFIRLHCPRTLNPFGVINQQIQYLVWIEIEF